LDIINSSPRGVSVARPWWAALSDGTVAGAPLLPAQEPPFNADPALGRAYGGSRDGHASEIDLSDRGAIRDYVAGLERTAVRVEDAARRLMPPPLPAAASPSRSRIAGATRVTIEGRAVDPVRQEPGREGGPVGASMSSGEGSGLGL
jgi:hypothetical protein